MARDLRRSFLYGNWNLTLPVKGTNLTWNMMQGRSVCPSGSRKTGARAHVVSTADKTGTCLVKLAQADAGQHVPRH